MTNNLKYKDNVNDYLVYQIQNNVNDINILRDYQKEALESWITHNKKGCIILPTGAGKTIIALKAITEVNSSTLVHSTHIKFNGTMV